MHQSRSKSDRPPKRVVRWLAATLLAGVVGPTGFDGTAATASADAASESADEERPLDLALNVRRARLDNGLRVVMNRDATSPTVAICVTYAAGSNRERAGRRGLAHLLEHLTYEGGEHVGRGQYVDWIAEQGGVANAVSTPDHTAYYSVLPSHALALGLWLEAERMKHLDLTERGLERQRRVARAEYRARVTSKAYASGYHRLRALVFANHPAYDTAPIGKPGDVEQASVAWVREFAHSYHSPGNAVLSLSGNFQAVEAMRLVHEYFGDAVGPEAPAPPSRELSRQPSGVRASVQDDQATTVGLLFGWAVPGARSPEHRALELAAALLTEGATSRLPHLLVSKEGVARRVSAWTDDHAGPDLFGIRVLLREDADPELVRRMVDGQLGALARWGPKEPELERAQKRVRQRLLTSIEGNLGRARRLGALELHWGDARLLGDELARYREIAVGDVQSAVARYLTRASRSEVTVLPTGRAKLGRTDSSSSPSGSQAWAFAREPLE